MADYFAHETAVIDAGAEIGAGTRIWHFSHVMGTARIGKNCIVGQNAYIDRDVTLGDGCKVQNNVSLYKGVVLEDDVFIGPSAVFTNVLNPRAFLEKKHEFKTTRVRKGASVGANATVVCPCDIGEYALIGAGAVVTHDVPAHALLVGVPARQIGWVCRCGTTLVDDLCPACGWKR